MVTANGVFEVDISLFRDPSFQQQITPETASSPVSFAEGEVVFVSVELKSKDLFPPGASVLVMDTCFVTSEQSTREPLTYLFHDGWASSCRAMLWAQVRSQVSSFRGVKIHFRKARFLFLLYVQSKSFCAQQNFCDTKKCGWRTVLNASCGHGPECILWPRACLSVQEMFALAIYKGFEINN